MNNTGIIILAAGNSSRLGRPKQLLPYAGTTLIGHVVAEAFAAALTPVVVVTGALDSEIRGTLREQHVRFIHNPDWEKGMSSGIVAGLVETIAWDPRVKGVIVAVCDQPFISAELFRSLLEERSVSKKRLIASFYSGTTGTPVLFDKFYFDKLLALSGNGGAKKILDTYPGDVSTVPFPRGGIDIDTREDFENWVNNDPGSPKKEEDAD